MGNVRVKVLIPQQEFYFWYDEGAWEGAVRDNEVDILMDWDLSDLDPQMEVYGPDGAPVEAWA